MGGGSLPSPAITAGNHHSQPHYLSTGSSYLTDENNRRAIVYPKKSSFGPIPSQIEVQNAISDLRRAMNGSEINEIMEQWDRDRDCDSSRTVMKSLGRKRLLDAYHLLQTDPMVQRLVVSISSDAEVWYAILKNDAVRGLHGSLPLTATEEDRTVSYMHEPNSTHLIVNWIFGVMRSKIFEFLESLEVLVFKTLHSVSENTRSTSKHGDIMEEKVRSSLLLSIVILVIVFVTRSMET